MFNLCPCQPCQAGKLGRKTDKNIFCSVLTKKFLLFCSWDWFDQILNLQWSEKERRFNFKCDQSTEMKNIRKRICSERPQSSWNNWALKWSYPMLPCCTQSRPLLAKVLRAVRAALLWLPSRVDPAPWLTCKEEIFQTESCENIYKMGAV